MKKYDHLRKKAIELRGNGYSLDDISSMLNKPKTTVYYWIKDVEIKKPNAFLMRTKRKNKVAAKKAAEAVRKKFELIHEESRSDARELWNKELRGDDGFKQFLMLYWCEGWKKTKHCVAIANSDADLIEFAHRWLKRINRDDKKIDYSVQIHKDQDELEVLTYWRGVVGCNQINMIRKSNTGQMSGRKWASKHGVFTIRLWDAYSRTKMDEWLKLFREEMKNKLEV